MNRRSFFLPIALLGVSLATAWAVAAPNDATLDPEKGGLDFRLQGEYRGNAGDQTLGVQVIAQGNGTFEAVFLPGGLPGEGWDGKTRVRVPGKLDGNRAVFGTEGAGWSGRIAEKQFTGQTDKGTKFELRQVLRQSKTLGKKAPEGAVVLFDGSSASAWEGGRVSPDGALEVGTQTKQKFGDYTLHLEFRTPFMPEARGQSRGNSGIFFQDAYEVQILDSFGLDGKNNECGGIYTVSAPAVNMCYPPLSWQTYDVEFTAARFDDQGKKVKNAVLTVWHNGVLVQDHVEVPRNTAGGGESAQSGRLQYQNHGNPVQVRNVWLVEKK